MKRRLLSIMAHQDDWELTTAGLWAKLRKRGLDFEGLVMTTTDGRSGHHKLSPAECARVRAAEARRAAATLGCRAAVLRDWDGKTFWNGQLQCDTRTRGAVWKLIRDFRPDVVFCPPRPHHWRAGCHNDHVVTADLVWSVAYQVQVPHAFPQYGMGREKEPLSPPLIVAAYDVYLEGSGWDLAVDITDSFEAKLDAAECHRSQVYEWLPWVGKYPAPRDRREFAAGMRKRHLDRSRGLGIRGSRLLEFFCLTSWGRPATRADLAAFFPGCRVSPSGRRLIRG